MVRRNRQYAWRRRRRAQEPGVLFGARLPSASELTLLPGFGG